MSSKAKQRIIFGAIYALIWLILITCMGWYQTCSNFIMPCLMMATTYEASKAICCKQIWTKLVACVATLLYIVAVFLSFDSAIITPLALVVIAICLFFAVLVGMLIIYGEVGVSNGAVLVVLLLEIWLSMTLLWYHITALGSVKFLILALLLPATVDTIAYAFGSLWGKKKMGLKVSPNKSWVGFWTGLMSGPFLVLFAMIAGLLPRLQSQSWSSQLVLKLVVVGVVVGLVAQCGDWLASGIKRVYGLKDFANLIPGHGGLLDRLDSVMPVAMVLHLFYMVGWL